MLQDTNHSYEYQFVAFESALGGGGNYKEPQTTNSTGESSCKLRTLLQRNFPPTRFMRSQLTDMTASTRSISRLADGWTDRQGKPQRSAVESTGVNIN